MENDIRKTGALNYRLLQSQNNRRTALDDRFKIQLPASNADPANFLPRYEKSALLKEDGSDYWGNSMFDDDKYGLTLGAWEGVLDIRADNQPWYAKAAAGIGKAVTTALTTFLSGTAGLATGIVQSVINACTGENVVSGLWDNPVTQFLNGVNEKMEEWMPNYYTRAEQNRPWYLNLGTMNFWFDSVVKNMGFTIGAVYSGGLATKAINWVVGLSKAGKLAKMAGVALQELQAGAKAAQALKATRRVKMFAGSLVAAESEGAIEAINASNDFVRLQNQKISTDIAERTNKAFLGFISNGGLLDEYGNPIDDGSSNYHNLMGTLNNLTVAELAARKEVDKARTGVGNFTLAGNLPILMFSNMVTFGKTFAGGWKAARNLGRAEIKGTKEAIKEAKQAAKNGDPTKLNQIKSLVERAEKSGFKGFTDLEKAMVELYKSSLLKDTKLGAAYAVLKSPVTEGNEEMAQGAVSLAALHFYEGDVDYIYRSKLGEDIKKKDFWDNLGSSLGQGIEDYYGNIERWEEGFIGALTGLLGSPTFGRSQNSGNTTYLGKGKKIGMSGGAIAEYREWKDTRDLRKKRLLRANVAIKDHDKLEKELRHLAALMRIAKDQQNYLLHDDEFNWKNARTAALFEDIMHLKRVGRLDMVKSIMQQMDDFTLEDAQEILEEAKKQTSTSMTEQELQKVQQEKDLYDKEIEQRKVDIASIEQNIQSASERGESQATMQLYYDKLQLYNKALNTAQNESAIRQSILNGDTLTRSQYTHTDGTMFTALEVLDDLKKRKTHYNKMIDQIAAALEEIDFATGENILDDDLLDTLTWYRVMAEDWLDRAESIVKENEAVIDAVLSNDKLTTLIETLEELEGFKKDNRVEKELKAMIGGVLAHTSPQELRNVKNALAFLKTALHTEGARYNVARILAKGIIDASGKSIMTAELVRDLMKSGIEASNAYKSAQEKIKRDIDDLVNIGLAFEKYNELLGEYTKDPNKITVAHEAADKKEAEKENNKRKNEIKKNSKGKSKALIAIDTLDDDIETVHEALDLEDEGTKGKDDTPGEENSLKGSDTPKEPGAGDLVIETRIALSEILAAAQKDPSLTTALKEWLRRLVLSPEIMEDVNSVSEIIPALIKAITEGKLKAVILSDNSGKTEEDLLDLIENAETNIHKFLLELTPKLQDYVDATIDAATKNRDPEEIRRAADTPEESNSTKGKNDTPLEEGAKKADTPNEELEEEEEGDEDWNNGQHGTMPTATNTEQKANNKAINFRQLPRLGISTEYAQRPWLSLLYLNAVDLLTYADYLEAHPEATPKGVDKAAYLKYVKAITKLIYFNYVRGLNPNERLLQGDAIEFIVDKIINEAAGTTVVLMRSNGLIIGSLPSALDFETVDKNGTKLAEKIPLIYSLYKAVVEETAASAEEGNTAVATITSKVVSLMGGSPAFSATNRTVSNVFGEETPSLAIVSNLGEVSLFGMTQEDINALSTFPNNMMTKGLVYVFVTSNRGTKLPLLAVGKQLSEVFKNKNDWYTKSTIAAILECADGLDLGTKKAQLAKWIPFFFKGGLNNVSINIATSKTGKRQLLIKWGKEDKTFKNAVSFAIDKNGKISEDKVLSFLKAIANTTVNSNGKALKPTINVNKHMLNDADYVKHITLYLYINIVKGETRTVNDWFTYEMPKLETKPVERNETYVDSEGKTRNKNVPIVNMSVERGGRTLIASFLLGTAAIKIVTDAGQISFYINDKKVEGPITSVEIIKNTLFSLCKLFLDFESTIKTESELNVVIEIAKTFSQVTNDPFTILNALTNLLSNSDLIKQFHSTNDAVKYLRHRLAQNFLDVESQIFMPVIYAFNNMTNNDPLEALLSGKDKSKIIDSDSVITALKDPFKAFDIIMAVYQENPDNNTYKLVGELFTRYTPEVERMEAVVKNAYKVIEAHKKSSEEAPIASTETEEKTAEDEAAKKKAAEALSRVSRKGSGRPRPSRPVLSGRRNNKKLSTVSSTLEQAPATKAQRRKELSWLYKMLPLLTEEERLLFVEDLIDVAERGEKAWGMYSDGITTISKLAVYGTVYHEAFHAVFDLYLSEEEKTALLSEAKETFHLGEVSDELAEEALAEGFKHFMINPNQLGFGKRILNFFRNLFNQITGWRFAGKSIDAYYRRIAKGGYANYNTIYTYHGTGAPVIDKFDDRFLFTGEGATAYTSGFYFTSNKLEAAMYRIRALSSRLKNYVTTVSSKGLGSYSIADIVDELNTWSSTIKLGKTLSERDTTEFRKLVTFFARDAQALEDFKEIVSTVSLRNDTIEMLDYKLRAIKEQKGILAVIKRLFTNTSKLYEMRKKVLRDSGRALNSTSNEASRIRDLSKALANKYNEFKDTEKTATNLFMEVDDAAKFATEMLKSVHGGKVYRVTINKNGKFLDLDASPNQETLKNLVNIKNTLLNKAAKSGALIKTFNRMFALQYLSINFLPEEYKTFNSRISLESLPISEQIVFINTLFENASTVMYKIRILEAILTSIVGGALSNAFPQALADITKMLIEEGGYVGAIHHSKFSGAIHHILYSSEGISLKEAKQTPMPQFHSTVRYSTPSTTQKLNLAVQDLQKEHLKIFREEALRFLDNFGIKIQDMKDYNSDMPLFDALDKVIYTDGGKNLTDTVGYAIAFLMLHTPEVKNMIKTLVKGNDGLFIKGQRRHINKSGKVVLPHFNAQDWENIDKDKALKEVGKEIAYELRRLYGIEKPKEKRSKVFLNRLALLVRKLFDILTPQNRIAILALRHSAINIANSVKLNDPSVVLTSLKKPGTSTVAQRVDLAKALRENKLERDIIETLLKYNIAIAGSATIAIAGTLFRPVENPLHDIDFEAEGYTKELLYNILKKEFKHVMFKHTIINSNIGSHCETFLIMDRDFKYGRTETIIEREGGKNKEKLKQWLVDKNGNEIGYFINSDLVLNDGVKGKFLDFFIQPLTRKPSEVKLNDRNYLIADWRNSMSPKLNWARTKDIWDYIRFLTNKQYDELLLLKRKEEELARMKLLNSKVIWGHPTIGKTKYLETHDDILEWDKEINTKRNEFIAKLIDPNNELSRTSEEYIYKKREYMTNWEQHPEYIEFLTTLWKNLLERGKKEGKTIFASPLPLLRLFPSTFDLILAINSRDFIQRNILRGDGLTETVYWKLAINDVLVKIDPEKIIFTNEYFADFMSRMLNSETNALTDELYAGLIEALDYKNLTQEAKDYLETRKITEEEYLSLDTLWKQLLLKCM